MEEKFVVRYENQVAKLFHNAKLLFLLENKKVVEEGEIRRMISSSKICI